MATKYSHVQLGVVDSSGQVNIMYPITTGEDVTIKYVNSNVPTGITTIGDLVNALGSMAFNNGTDMIYLGNESDIGDTEYPTPVDSEINDNISARDYTYSSAKIDEMINAIKEDLVSYQVSNN